VLAATVTRTDAVITGLLGGVAVAALAAAFVLTFAGGVWARILVIVCAGVFALRARVYGSVRQRLAALSIGAGPALPVVLWAVWTGSAAVETVTGAALAGAITIIVSTGNLASTTFTRVADWLENLGILAVVPLVCAVLGLFTRANGLS
jgi:hypothetical protein